jgi:3-oxoacyl-[acyl-carrier-protein] synthase-3
VVRARLVSTGMAVPDRIINNFDLEKMVDTTDQWIQDRTGMFERHVSDDNTAASDLALQASLQALKAAGITAQELDAIMIGTISGDYVFPATACVLQDKLGASNCMAFDFSAACSGFIYGLSIAQAYIESGRFRNILLVGVDLLTKVVDWTDRQTCVLFGDGAGAAVIQPHDSLGVIETICGSDGSAAELLYQPCGGSRIPISANAIEAKKHYLYMDGRSIFKQAVRVMAQACQDVLKHCNTALDEVALVIPHQANVRIIEAIAQRLDLSMDKVFVNVQKYANTSAATIPIALHEARQEGRLPDGEKVLLVSFGGGLTWGASLIQF